MIATLAMYDRVERRAALDALWAAIRDHLRSAGQDAPEHLNRSGDLWPLWQDPSLLIGETCGYPFANRLFPQVQVFGVFDHGLPDTPKGHYRSVLIAPGGATEPREGKTLTLAYNDTLSQSGYHAVQTHARSAGWTLNPGLKTGAHLRSAEAIAEGHADLAGIDAVTWRDIARWMPDLANAVRVIGETQPTPGLPLITARGRAIEPLLDAVSAGLLALDPRDRDALKIRAVLPAQDAVYLEAYRSTQ